VNWLDAIIAVMLAAGAYVGAQRGWLVAGLELASAALAWTLAWFGYQALGTAIKTSLGLATALANVAAFFLIIGLVELVVALGIRFLAMPRMHEKLAWGRHGQTLGSAIATTRTALLFGLILMVVASLPLGAGLKGQVSGSFIAQSLLTVAQPLRWLVDGGLLRDAGDSYVLLTTTSQPTDTRKVKLGFTTTTGTVDAEAEAEMLRLVNRERTSRGLEPLTLNTGARAVARDYSRQMLADGLFSHTDKAGRSPFDRLKAGGVQYGIAGENLALAPTLRQAHKGLMDSPGHRANILRSTYRSIGIGIIDAGRHGLMVTQNFTD
jgi:uncharacterized protein YkwD/uncharacterized membrane protein required for colicin V production